VTDVVHPAERLKSRTTGLRTTRRLELNLGKNNLNVRLVHKIRITIDHRRDTLVEVSLTVERHLDRLHGEVRVTLV